MKALALVLLVMTASLAHAQQQSSKPGSSSSSSSNKRAPYSCFYNECAPIKPVQSKGQFQSCLELGVRMPCACGLLLVVVQ
jgi:hypothetical protein